MFRNCQSELRTHARGAQVAVRAHPRPPSARPGLSLLEVILALAILGGSIAVIGEMVRTGSMAAAQARDLTTAQLLCETKLAEIAAGLEPMQTLGLTPFDPTIAQGWSYAVNVQPIDDQGLSAVQVLVEQDPGEVQRPVYFQLTRWIVDPAAQSAALEATSGATGGTMTSTGTL